MNTSAVAFRIPVVLRQQAKARSKELGISLAFVVKSALADFIRGDKIIFSSAPIEILQVSPHLQERADTVAALSLLASDIVSKNYTTEGIGSS